MKPLTLHPHEILQALRTGSVLVVRVVKLQPEKWIDRYGPSASPEHWLPSGVYISDQSGFLGKGAFEVRGNGSPVKSPFGPVGSQFWCKEKWRPILSGMLEGGTDYYLDDPGASGDGFSPWNPARTMKQQHSRLTLTVQSINVKRVQEVTEGEAANCGCERPLIRDGNYGPFGLETHPQTGDYLDAFKTLWNKLNPQHPWESSPWVWLGRMETIK